ncbi:uncharacterized protein TNCV_2533461 [Trichonephila clavipes]|nr:uncharacterized protein TNCV_2533461 [Trichonephila clavipes]
MAFLLRERKDVLLEVAKELRVEIDITLPKIEFKKRICQSKYYDEESVKCLLEGILAEKRETRENERETREYEERKLIREFELQRLRAQLSNKINENKLKAGNRINDLANVCILSENRTGEVSEPVNKYRPLINRVVNKSAENATSCDFEKENCDPQSNIGAEFNFEIDLPGKRDRSTIYRLNLIKLYRRKPELANLVLENSSEGIDSKTLYSVKLFMDFGFQGNLRKSQVYFKLPPDRSSYLRMINAKKKERFLPDPETIVLRQKDINLVTRKPFRIKTCCSSQMLINSLREDTEYLLDLGVNGMGQSNCTQPVVWLLEQIDVSRMVETDILIQIWKNRVKKIVLEWLSRVGSEVGPTKVLCEGDTRNRWRDGHVCPDVGQGTMAPWARRLGGEGKEDEKESGRENGWKEEERRKVRKRRTKKVGRTDGKREERETGRERAELALYGEKG